MAFGALKGFGILDMSKAKPEKNPTQQNNVDQIDDHCKIMLDSILSILISKRFSYMMISLKEIIRFIRLCIVENSK